MCLTDTTGPCLALVCSHSRYWISTIRHEWSDFIVQIVDSETLTNDSMSLSLVWYHHHERMRVSIYALVVRLTAIVRLSVTLVCGKYLRVGNLTLVHQLLDVLSWVRALLSLLLGSHREITIVLGLAIQRVLHNLALTFLLVSQLRCIWELSLFLFQHNLSMLFS